jgi:hypothetical protein
MKGYIMINICIAGNKSCAADAYNMCAICKTANDAFFDRLSLKPKSTSKHIGSNYAHNSSYIDLPIVQPNSENSSLSSSSKRLSINPASSSITPLPPPADAPKKLAPSKQPVKCSYDGCDVVSSNAANFRRHERLKHSTTITTIYTCDKCDHTCNLKDNMKRHKQKHK